MNLALQQDNHLDHTCSQICAAHKMAASIHVAACYGDNQTTKKQKMAWDAQSTTSWFSGGTRRGLYWACSCSLSDASQYQMATYTIACMGSMTLARR